MILSFRLKNLQWLPLLQKINLNSFLRTMRSHGIWLCLSSQCHVSLSPPSPHSCHTCLLSDLWNGLTPPCSGEDYSCHSSVASVFFFFFKSELVLCQRRAVGAGNEGLESAQVPGTSWCLCRGFALLPLLYPICPRKEEKRIRAASVERPRPGMRVVLSTFERFVHRSSFKQQMEM